MGNLEEPSKVLGDLLQKIEQLQKEQKFFDSDEKKNLREKIVTVEKMIFKKS